MFYYYDPMLCPRCHSPIEDINEIHVVKEKNCVPKKHLKGAFVYLMHDIDQNLLKIGFTSNPQRRFKEIQNGTNNKVEFLGHFPGSKTNEAILHQRWKSLKFKLEWFHYDEQILEYFIGHPKLSKL